MQHFITIFCWDYLESIFPERLGKDHPSQHRRPDSSVPDWEDAIRKFKDRPWSVSTATAPSLSMPSSGPWALLSPSSSTGGGWDWAGSGIKPRRSLKDGEEWLDGDLTDILGYSATVFISGTRFFIYPPALPRVEGRSRSCIKKAFILERMLGMLFSVLFFVAINRTIVRAS